MVDEKNCEHFAISLTENCLFCKQVKDKVSGEVLQYCTHSKRYGFICRIKNK